MGELICIIHCSAAGVILSHILVSQERTRGRLISKGNLGLAYIALLGETLVCALVNENTLSVRAGCVELMIFPVTDED